MHHAGDPNGRFIILDALRNGKKNSPAKKDPRRVVFFFVCKSRHRVLTAVFICEIRSTTWDSELRLAFLSCKAMHRGYNVTGPAVLQCTTEMIPFKNTELGPKRSDTVMQESKI